jgi:GcrA cell cycle regulator
MMRCETWSDDDVDVLKTLWAEGVKAHDIAAKLGGLTRSAVLGKIFRLRLAPVANANKLNAQIAATVNEAEPIGRRRRSFRPAKPYKPRDERQGKTLFELTNTCCRWPYRRPGTEHYFFCGAAGADLEGGVPYCPRHMKRAYLTPPPRAIESRRKTFAGLKAKATSAA